jgi:ribosomal-protein-alanine N-acetyltransferase
MRNKEYKIRGFTIEDLPRVMKINESCLPENYSSFFYRDLYTRYPETFLVAEVNGEIQGYVMCRIERGFSKLGKMLPTKLSHIVSIAVMKDYRRLGIAENLMKETMKRSVQHHSTTECYLEVRVTNEAALKLYLKLKFSKIKRNYGYYIDGEDAWVMALPLDKLVY